VQVRRRALGVRMRIKMKSKIYVSISGGCYREAKNVPTGHEIEVID